MNFIKKIVEGDIDEKVHLQFQKFSKGEFVNRALLRAKNSSGKYTLHTSAEFANELVENIADSMGENSAKVSGAIVSTNDLKGEIDFKEIKQFQGVKRYLMDKEMSGKEIVNLLHKFPKTFFALSFEYGDNQLKIKPKAPKSGKPGSKGEDAPKADFCVLKTKDKSLIESFIFEKKDFKEAEINHKFLIESIVVPDELKNSKDFAEIREKSKRKGKIIRKALIDGQQLEKEISFEA